jgi:hypothetical protein
MATPRPGAGIRNVALAPGALQVATGPPKITGASATAPFMGLAVTLTIMSTGPCSVALVDWGDSPSGAEGHALKAASTQLPPHVYATPGLKTIKVGGADASYWASTPNKKASHVGDYMGEAPVVSVTLRSGTMAAPALRK